MSFQGDLNDFELREIMHFIGDRMKDGELVLRSGDRNASVEFGKGKITRVTLHTKPPLVVRLEEAGFVPSGTAAKMAGAETDDIAQRQLILSKKVVDKDEFNRFLVREIAKDLAELMFWEEADFEFTNADESPPPLVELKVDLAVQEAISMSVELRNLKKRFPDGTTIRLSATPAGKMITIEPEEWDIVARFSKDIKVEDLAKASGRDSFTFFELLARVADRGLLVVEEIKEKEEMEEKEDTKVVAEKEDKDEKPEKKPEAAAKPDLKVEPKQEQVAEIKPETPDKKPEAPINGKYVAVA